MSNRRRMLGTALGSFLVGGVTVGLALAAAGALPETGGGLALGALLVFPIFFRVLLGLFFLTLILRFFGFRRRWSAVGGPSWPHGGDPRSRIEDWHRRAHEGPEADTDDQNAPDEVDSRH